MMRNRNSNREFNARLYAAIRKDASKEQSIKNKEIWSDPDQRAHRISKKIGRKHSPETIVKMKAAALLRHKLKPLSREVRNTINQKNRKKAA